VSAPILHVSAYRFVALGDLEGLRQHLFDAATARQLRGTVVLAEEGINLALAGAPGALRDWLVLLRRDPRFDALPTRDSVSRSSPFERLKVRIRREIIRMGLPAIRPADGRAPAVAPATLERWLGQGRDDEGRPLTMLDARNVFEVDAGAFEGAVDLRLQRFSDFPAALAARREAFAGRTVVSYCTGGIRCEKAALVIRRLGVEHGWQLDGGILGYFAATGGRAPGWRGRCVVFDGRGALGPDLAS